MPIQINIQAGKDANSTQVKVTGEVRDLVSKEDRRLFGVEDQKLIELLGVMQGKAPDSVHLRDHSLFEKYGWDMVHRVLQVESAEVVSLEMQPVALVSNRYENLRDKKPITHRASLTHQATISASTNWNDTVKLGIKQKIKYNIGVPAAGLSGETSLSFEATHGTGASESRGTTISTTNLVIFEVDAGQTAKAVLSASKGVLRVKINYRATLEGDVYYDYPYPHKGHHHYRESIHEIMRAGNVPDVIQTSEIIEVGFYADALVVVEDGRPIRNGELEDESSGTTPNQTMTFPAIITQD